MVEELEERVEGLMARVTERLETELDRTRAEKRALRRFAEDVHTLDFGTPTHAPDGQAVGTAGTGGPAVRTVTAEKTGAIEKIRRAYESTVMAVPHYAEEYDDTYRKSLESEFSPEIALLLTRNRTVQRKQRTVLLEAVDRSVRQREAFIETLEGERESVRRHATDVRQIAGELSSLAEITGVAKTFGDYDGIRSRLLQLETTIDEIARSRQETVFDRRRDLSLPVEGPDLQTYLYSELAHSYPILGTTVDLEEGRVQLQTQAERGLTVTN